MTFITEIASTNPYQTHRRNTQRQRREFSDNQKELLKSDFVAEGGHQQEPEGHYGKGVIHIRVQPEGMPQATSLRACGFHQL